MRFVVVAARMPFPFGEPEAVGVTTSDGFVTDFGFPTNTSLPVAVRSNDPLESLQGNLVMQM